MTFANIEYFFLLLLLIPYILWYVLKNKKKEPTLLVSDTTAYRYAPKSYKNHLIHVPFILRLFTLSYWLAPKPVTVGKTLRLRA